MINFYEAPTFLYNRYEMNYRKHEITWKCAKPYFAEALAFKTEPKNVVLFIC